MKKLVLSALVLIIFTAYSVYLKLTPPQDLPLAGPVSSPTPNPTDTPVPTSAETNHLPTNIVQPTVVPTNAPTATPTKKSGKFKDGQYTGNAADAYYGNIQVKVTISNGAISDVQFLQYPNDRSTSVMINTQAMPYFKSEAIAAQSANVDVVSGATDSSHAFQESLQSALSQAT